MVTLKAHLGVRMWGKFCCCRLMMFTTQSLHIQGSLLLTVQRKTRHLHMCWLPSHLLSCLCQVTVESHLRCSMKFASCLQRWLRIEDRQKAFTVSGWQSSFFQQQCTFHRQKKLRKESSKTIAAVISTVGISGVVYASSEIPILLSSWMWSVASMGPTTATWVAFHSILYNLRKYYTSDTVLHVNSMWFL